MAENFKKNIGTLESEEAPSYYSKFNITQKFVLAKLIFTSPEEHFQPFFWNIRTLEFYSDFEPTIFEGVVKTAFYMSGGTFCYKRYFTEKIIIS